MKIPALLHLTRLKYKYISLKLIDNQLDSDTNIYKKSFHAALNKINRRTLTDKDIDSVIGELKTFLNAEDLGKIFYNKFFTGVSFEDTVIRLIDFNRIENNIFEVATEVPYRNGADSFRPDITIFINGMPLAFVEVKIPDNDRGIQAERRRMIERFYQEKFRRFANITQLMIFSNNSEYDDEEFIPIQGSFYAVSDYREIFFNRFREEDAAIFDRIAPIEPDVETEILKETNHLSIRAASEYETNKNPLTPANKILTSLLSIERFMFILRCGFAYIEEKTGGFKKTQKHVMRYQQLFAALAIQKMLEAGIKRGVIWHTQGSGKTALAYYSVGFLIDLYQRKNISAQFFFVVDRLELLQQAANEFRKRGLEVGIVNSKDAFVDAIQRAGSITSTGKPFITVVNIQKFSEESVAVKPQFNINVQRIYFIDEAHRGYKWDGSFLARLMQSDRDAVMIALTGTPLIGEYKTRDIFGNYIHTYYYNQSIADGYTLRLIREGIKTEYRLKLQAALSWLKVQVEKGSVNKKEIYSHEKYIAPLVEYIENDFEQSRLRFNDPTIGALIACDSSDQAKAIYNKLIERGNFSAELILSTVGYTDRELNDKRNRFKDGEVDIVVVYRMLLTGFDAHRLKKLYLGRKIKEHNLLQALTRVNRPYGNWRYGYVVDFADIRDEFDKTNRAYLQELRLELGDDFPAYQKIFKSPEEIDRELSSVQKKLFQYNTDNAEVFRLQIQSVENKDTLIDLRRAIDLYKQCYNLVEQYDYDDLRTRFDVDKIADLSKVLDLRIKTLNRKEAFNNTDDMSALINLAVDDLEFNFKKVSEHEMGITNDFLKIRQETCREFAANADKKDPEYTTLREELKRILDRHNIEEMSAAQMQFEQQILNALLKKIHDLNAANDRLTAKYFGDQKFMRVHKRLSSFDGFNSQILLHDFLSAIKFSIDDKVSSNSAIVDNAAYFNRELIRDVNLRRQTFSVPLTAEDIKIIAAMIAQEYIDERNAAL